MKKYTVEWIGAQAEDSIVHTIEAENYRDAFDIATKCHKYPLHPRIFVFGDGFMDNDELDNPHYAEPRKADTKTIGEPHSRRTTPLSQPAPTVSHEESSLRTISKRDGSVGWFENIDGSSLTEKQILLAQLSELRMIKRCVVGTIVIVVIIPFVMVAILAT